MHGTLGSVGSWRGPHRPVAAGFLLRDDTQGMLEHFGSGAVAVHEHHDALPDLKPPTTGHRRPFRFSSS